MEKPSLAIQVIPGLKLRDPFMLASSHWTSTPSSFRQLASFDPAAVTLKTTSAKTGGDGSEGTRVKRELINQFGDPFAYYSDGPKSYELWDLLTTRNMSSVARSEFGENTALGLSVLQGEDYEDFGKVLDLSLYQYVELNWKYTFRNLLEAEIEARIADVADDLKRFMDAFQNLPKLIKLSRESLRYLDQTFFASILSTIAEAGAGIIVANSLKTRVPPSRLTKNSSELTRGVVTGECLFLDTYNSIRDLDTRKQSQRIPAIVASGGIMDLGCAIDVMAIGANAVQLCSALDVRGPAVLNLLREQMSLHCREYGDLAAMLSLIRSSTNDWAEIATSAANETRELEEVVSKTLAQTDRILKLVEETLKVEATVAPANESVDYEHPPAALKDAKIVVGRGNILTSFVMSRIAQELQLESTPLDSTYHLRQQLFGGKLRYDFAITTKSVLDYMASRGKSDLQDREPVELGNIGTSFVELVGDSRVGLNAIKIVHHFTGVTGRRALENLLRDKPLGIVSHPIESSKLLPTLRFWQAEAGILAKPPLSRIYGLLVREDLSAHWLPLWNWREDLLLVTRRGFLEAEGGEAACDYMLRRIREISKEAANDPSRAAKESMDGYYWTLFARLLGGRAFW